MRVVVVGATGNLGTSLLTHLTADPDVSSLLGIARRLPEWRPENVEWRAADIVEDDLESLFRGADAVAHLAWAIQPSRDERTLAAVNVDGSERVFRAAAAVGVPRLVYASSVGTYSPGPKDRAVDESHPTGGVSTSFYSRHKAAVESILDGIEARHPEMAVARMRPGLIFKREAATGIRRYFAGPLLPSPMVRRGLIPIVPDIARLRFQAVHSLDVGRAFHLAIKRGADRAFNVAAEPVLDPERLADLLGARRVKLPAEALRVGAYATWKLHLQPTPPGWLDMALAVPIMDSSRARNELGWEPEHTAGEALMELLEGIREGAGFPTPPLDPSASGPARMREALTGVGGRSF
jgi:nucleoside-diphosphate-sugar epimerase